jgi:hypothetical protein
MSTIGAIFLGVGALLLASAISRQTQSRAG